MKKNMIRCSAMVLVVCLMCMLLPGCGVSVEPQMDAVGRTQWLDLFGLRLVYVQLMIKACCILAARHCYR